MYVVEEGEEVSKGDDGVVNMSEHDTQTAILEYLNLVGHYCWRNNTGAMVIDKRFFRYGKKGSSDILGVSKDGKMIAIEVKAKGKKPTLEQSEFLLQVSSRGGIAGVAYSVDDAIALLDL